MAMADPEADAAFDARMNQLRSRVDAWSRRSSLQAEVMSSTSAAMSSTAPAALSEGALGDVGTPGASMLMPATPEFDSRVFAPFPNKVSSLLAQESVQESWRSTEEGLQDELYLRVQPADEAEPALMSGDGSGRRPSPSQQFGEEADFTGQMSQQASSSTRRERLGSGRSRSGTPPPTPATAGGLPPPSPFESQMARLEERMRAWKGKIPGGTPPLPGTGDQGSQILSPSNIENWSNSLGVLENADGTERGYTWRSGCSAASSASPPPPSGRAMQTPKRADTTPESARKGTEDALLQQSSGRSRSNGTTRARGTLSPRSGRGTQNSVRSSHKDSARSSDRSSQAPNVFQRAQVDMRPDSPPNSPTSKVSYIGQWSTPASQSVRSLDSQREMSVRTWKSTGKETERSLEEAQRGEFSVRTWKSNGKETERSLESSRELQRKAGGSLEQRVSGLEESMHNIDHMLRFLVRSAATGPENPESRQRPRSSRSQRQLCSGSPGVLAGEPPEERPPTPGRRARRQLVNASPSPSAASRTRLGRLGVARSSTPPLAGQRPRLPPWRSEVPAVSEGAEPEAGECSSAEAAGSREARRGRFHWPMDIVGARAKLKAEVQEELASRRS